MKKCPFCAEEIQDEAIVCRFCGRDLRQPVSPVRLQQQPVQVQAKNPYSPGKRKAINAAVVIVIGLCMCLFITNFARDPKPNPETTVPSETAILSSIEIRTSTPEPTKKPTRMPLPTNILPPTDIPLPTDTLEPRAALKAEISRALGSGNRDIARLTNLNFDDPEQGAIFVNWAINDNLTERIVKYGAKHDAVKILKAMHDSGTDYTYVILSGSFSMQDEYGNINERNVVNLTFYRETVEKINWDNFLNDNIYKVADEANVWVQFQD